MYVFFCFMVPPPTISPRTDTLFPSPTLFRSQIGDLNQSTVAQNVGSDGSQAFVSQLGDSGTSFVTQNAGANTAQLTQTASSLSAYSEITQGGGSGNSALVTQRAEADSFVTQTGSTNRSEEHTSEPQSLMRIPYAVS